MDKSLYNDRIVILGGTSFSNVNPQAISELKSIFCRLKILSEFLFTLLLLVGFFIEFYQNFEMLAQQIKKEISEFKGSTTQAIFRICSKNRIKKWRVKRIFVVNAVSYFRFNEKK